MSTTSSKLGIIDKVIFIALIIFTLVGVAITNISPAEAHVYWLVMNLVFAIGAIITGWHKAQTKKEHTKLDYFSIDTLGKYHGSCNDRLCFFTFGSNSE